MEKGENMKYLKLLFDKLHIRFLRLMNGNGFTMPDPDPKTYCMYNYCKSILNGETDTFQAYEDEINRLIKRYPKATRKDVAEKYIEVLEWIYGKEKF